MPKAPPLLFLLVSAATISPAHAAPQALGESTASIVAAGGVEIGDEAGTRRLVSNAGVTFALSARRNGAMAVGMPGFIAARQRAGARGLLLLPDGAEQFLTGTNLAFETLSVSVNRPFGQGASKVRPGGVTVVLAQYN